MRLSPIVATLALASSAFAYPAQKEDSLYQAMKKAGRKFIGTALTLRNETREGEIIKQEFNAFTPENSMKWESTEPSRDNFTFTDADRYAAYAMKNRLQVHCHTLVWHSQLPAWVSSGGFDNQTLIGIMENHIKQLVTRYKGICTRWDVVNEALEENGTYRKSVWLDTIGEAYLPIAFRLAKKYDNNVDLYYNDYNLEYNSNKTAGAVRIVKLLKSYGVKIDGVGYQAHLGSETTPTAEGPTPDQKTLEAALRATADLGVDVAYTEIDVRMNTPATPAKLQVQAAAYERIAKSCMAVKRCIGMTVWGISDKYSWIPGVFENEGAALVWDENYNKKPAYAGFLKGIRSKKYSPVW
ncbi:similar to endo-1,4-beta-xylanase [Plenodomus lingam JN3]|uniref:Beta-xylanase n=1 Tax=Leptosphaeria maculans (strain JN3 / isolate v23.1.3 / race Av1-4-5-6-7-8) TaxID=985895 RepID=E4ZH02_LEPMJ|nr:similar to endo-1,4-beta-xylanase [Plenodomus lingam JN3]CBX90572.1 similar to endo-1,4-beta-xylanase [Plenodomus lingam JN3]